MDNLLYHLWKSRHNRRPTPTNSNRQPSTSTNRRSSRFGAAFGSAQRLFSGGSSDVLGFDVSGWAEQFANGFEARGLPRDVVGR